MMILRSVRHLGLFLMLPFFSLPAYSEQECSISYLGRDAEHVPDGEPGGIDGVKKHHSAYGERLSGDSYMRRNVWNLYIPVLLDATSYLDKRTPAIDVFRVNCKD